MRTVLVVLALLTGCGKSRCEKYAEMEWRCGGYPAAEKDLVLKMSEGMCETTGSVEKALAAPVERGADCAEKFLTSDSADCFGYKQCKEAGPQ